MQFMIQRNVSQEDSTDNGILQMYAIDSIALNYDLDDDESVSPRMSDIS